MRVVKGEIVGNTVAAEEALPEGSAVGVVVRETSDDDIVLTEAMDRELLEASESARRGEALDINELLAQLEAIR